LEAIGPAMPHNNTTWLDNCKDCKSICKTQDFEGTILISECLNAHREWICGAESAYCQKEAKEVKDRYRLGVSKALRQSVTLRSPYGLPQYHRLPEVANFGGNGKPGILIEH